MQRPPTSQSNANILSIQGEIEGMEKQILSLNQKKEDLLVDLKAAIINLHQHLQKKQQELEKEVLSARTSEEDGEPGKEASEWKVGMTLGSLAPHSTRALNDEYFSGEKPMASMSTA